MKKALKLDKQGLKKERDELIFPYVQDWAGFCIRETKSTVEVRGIENLPQIADVTLLLSMLREMGADVKMVNKSTMDINLFSSNTLLATRKIMDMTAI